MSWFRWWDGTVTDPKWRVISSRTKQPVGSVIAVWACILEAARRNDGAIPRLDCEEIGALLGYETEAVQSIVKAMQDKGSLDETGVTNWRKRQPKREDDSRDRLRAWREKKRSEEICNAVVTHGNAPEAEAEAEAEADNRQTSSFHSDVCGGQKPASAKSEKIDPKKLEKFDPRKALSGHGCDPKHVEGWLEVRKAKRVPLTAAALDRLKSEADKANITIADAVRICAERGWQSFDASWKFDRPQSTADPPKTHVFLTPDDPGWHEWTEYRRRIGAPKPAPVSTHKDRKGQWFPASGPPKREGQPA